MFVGTFCKGEGGETMRFTPSGSYLRSFKSAYASGVRRVPTTCGPNPP